VPLPMILMCDRRAMGGVGEDGRENGGVKGMALPPRGEQSLRAAVCRVRNENGVEGAGDHTAGAVHPAA
jgi:hypothetical protein